MNLRAAPSLWDRGCPAVVKSSSCILRLEGKPGVARPAE